MNQKGKCFFFGQPNFFGFKFKFSRKKKLIKKNYIRENMQQSRKNVDEEKKKKKNSVLKIQIYN